VALQRSLDTELVQTEVKEAHRKAREKKEKELSTHQQAELVATRVLERLWWKVMIGEKRSRDGVVGSSD